MRHGLHLLFTNQFSEAERIFESRKADSAEHALGLGISAAGHVLATALTTASTGAVSPSDRGALLGLEHGLFSAARVVAPAAGIALLGAGGVGAVGAACAAACAAALGALWLSGGAAAAGDDESAAPSEPGVAGRAKNESKDA